MTCGNAANGAISHLVLMTPVVTAALTAVTAVFVALIGFFQYRANKTKLRLDLYNRRFDIYRRAVDLFHQLVVWDDSEATKSAHLDFLKSYRESRFLFDPKDGIYGLLEEMNTKAFKVKYAYDLRKMGAQVPTDVIQKSSNEQQEALEWFGKSISSLEERMSTYLNFHKISG